MTIFEGVSIFIAAVGLSFAIYEGRLNRQYHRISLKPKLIIRKHLGGSAGKFGISVTNEGSGVALINNCYVRIKGKEMTWGEVIKYLESPEDQGKIRQNVIAPRGAIAMGKSEWLLYSDLDNDYFRIKLGDAIEESNLDIKITYESVFQEKDEVHF